MTGLNRAERRRREAVRLGEIRAAIGVQERRRRSGNWPPWERRDLAPGEVGGRLWARDMHTAYTNRVYTVLVRTVRTGWGDVQHAMVSTLRGGDVPWRDKQRIKDELFGPHRTAVEVFPPAAELTDGADAYHLWVLPEGTALPFTIGPREDAA